MKKHRVLLLLLSVLSGGAGALPAQHASVEYGGAAGLGLELRRLGTTKRVLMIGAHPDDENTQILSALALGQGADVAYLSLTRGEGGQNGIGPELQEGLGLIRSEELLAARGLDAARQFFTRAYDFGFSKDADEAFRHWPRELLLADVVAVIRRLRPDVVVSVFSGTPRDGHGQHQVAGILAREAFEAAGDPGRFPEQAAAGLPAFAPRKLYLALWSGDSGAQARLVTGELDPLLGRSYYQVAMASRSLHRSQDMGQLLSPGPRSVHLRLIRANGAPVDSSASLFAGIDTTLAARLEGHGSAAAGRAAPHVASFRESVQRARAEFNPLEVDGIVPELTAAVRSLRAATPLLPDTASTAFHLREELEQAEAALWRASGLVLDALADDEAVVPGQRFTLTLTLWNGGRRDVAVDRLQPLLPAGWAVEPLDALPPKLAPGELLTRRFGVSVPAGAEPTRPYFLREPRRGDVYSWPDGIRVGIPFEPAPVRATARVLVEGVAAGSERDATFRDLDKRQGELRRPVRVVPPVALSLTPGSMVVPLASAAAPAPLRFTVRMHSEVPDGSRGTLHLRAPEGWSVEPSAAPIRFASAGEERSVEVTARPPSDLKERGQTLSATMELATGTVAHEGFTLVDYPHITPRALYQPAEARIHAFPVRIAPGVRVGYVAGAGDDTGEALRRLGAEVVPLSAQDLASGELSAFDAIVTGIRAYEVRPDLLAHNDRLLGYARQGGTVVVQYNKYEFAEPGIAPYPLQMARPHDRVTDEEAEVRLLEPEHPALSWPNRITRADFDGWVQERGLYYPRSWDARYTPLLEMADPGEEPRRGALLVAPVGEGVYVYTGLALFRQLPEGVPGAYRLLANLISLGNRR